MLTREQVEGLQTKGYVLGNVDSSFFFGHVPEKAYLSTVVAVKDSGYRVSPLVTGTLPLKFHLHVLDMKSHTGA